MLLHLSLVCGGIVFLWLGLDERGGPKGKDAASKRYEVRSVKLTSSAASPAALSTKERQRSNDSIAEDSRTVEPPQTEATEVPAPAEHRTERSDPASKSVVERPNPLQAKELRPSYPEARPAVPSQVAQSEQNTLDQKTPPSRRSVGSHPAPLWDLELEEESGERSLEEDSQPEQESQTKAATQSSPEPAGGSGGNAPSRPLYLPPVTLPENYRDFRSASLQVEFLIEADGRFLVRIVQGTGVEDLDREIEQTLRNAKWSPRRVAGVAVSDRRVVDIDIER